MTGILHTYIPNRVIDSNGIADGSSIQFYLTGTTTPAAIYTTDALSVELANPVVVAAGAEVPDIYLDPDITYRRLITFSDGSTQDTDPWTGIAGAGVSFEQTGTGSATQSIQDKGRNTYVHLMDKIDRSEWAAIEAGTSTYDATTAFYNAVAIGKEVRLPPGTVLLNPTNIGSASDIPSGMTIRGESREGSILRPYTAGSRLITIDSGDAAAFITDLLFENFTFYGTVEDDAFSEHVHLLTFNGVKDALVNNVSFKGFRGDGLYLGSGHTAGQERHNHRIRVQHSRFDGVNNDNRNGISVIDGVDITIFDNDFMNTTKSTMPGAIDVEPDAYAFHVVDNINVLYNRFRNIGGNIGQVSFPIPATVAMPEKVKIIGNTFDDYVGSGADITLLGFRDPSASDDWDKFIIDGNQGRDGYCPVKFFGVRGVFVGPGNQWEEYDVQAQPFGFSGAGESVRNIEWQAKLVLCGTTTSDMQGILLSACTNGVIRNAVLDRCGNAAAGGRAIKFHTGVTSAGIRLDNVSIVLNTSQTAAITSSGHTFTPAGNRIINCDLGGGTSDFSATAPGQLIPFSFTWDPGSLVDAAGETKASITVTGAAFGDQVQIGAPYDLQDMIVTAYVQATDTVEVRLQNESTATVDLASGTWKGTLMKALA